MSCKILYPSLVSVVSLVYYSSCLLNYLNFICCYLFFFIIVFASSFLRKHWFDVCTLLVSLVTRRDIQLSQIRQRIKIHYTDIRHYKYIAIVHNIIIWVMFVVHYRQHSLVQIRDALFSVLRQWLLLQTDLRVCFYGRCVIAVTTCFLMAVRFQLLQQITNWVLLFIFRLSDGKTSGRICFLWYFSLSCVLLTLTLI